MSDFIVWAVEGTDMGFIRQITWKWSQLQDDGTWETPAAEEVLWSEVMQLVAKYIVLWQVKVAHWVSLCPLMDVCARETCYEVGGWNIRLWWRQGTTDEELCNTLEESSRVL